MKFKNYVLMLALMMSVVPTAWSFSDFCRPLWGLKVEDIINSVSGTSCYENRNLKDHTKEICACMSLLTQDVPRLNEWKDLFNDRMLSSVQKNILTLATTQTKLEKDQSKSGEKKKKSDVENMLKDSFPKESEKLARMSKRLSANIHKFDFCGFTIDEYRRNARIPEHDLLFPENTGVQEGLWNDYLAANPDLLSISMNLSEPNKIVFRDKILGEFKYIRKHAPPGQRIFNKLDIETQKDTTIANVSNDKPEENLWLTLDESFSVGGKIRGILSEYSAESLKAQKENINRVKSFLDSGKDGFDINYKYLLENDGAWELYFNSNSTPGQSCSSAKAKTISFATDALSCVKNVSGFCALYEASKDQDTTKKQKNRMAELQFNALLTVEKSYEESIALYQKQGEMLCQSSLKLADVSDKNGKPIEASLNFESFKKRICDDKNIFITDSKIEMDKVELACENQNNSKLLGIYHRLVKNSDFTLGTNSKLASGEFGAFKLNQIRNFLKEKSRFDLPTENDEGNITTAVGSGNAKEASRVLASRIAQDRVYFENMRTISNASTGAPTNKKVMTEASVPSTQTIAPAEMPNVSGGFSSSTVAATKVEQQQILDEESRTISKTKKQISNLEDQVAADSSSGTNPDTQRLEKQIQELRSQLANSESRYQTALDTLNRVNTNKAPVSANNEKSTTGNQVQRTQASTQNLNTDNNVFNSQTSNQGQAKTGGPGAAQLGKLSTGGGSNSAAGSTNKALLQANNIDQREGIVRSSSGLILQTVKNEQNEEIGLIADPKIFQKFKNKDKGLYARYIQEMLDKNIDTLIIKNGDLVLRYKLVGKDSDNYNLQEELGPISVSERKYFSKDLSNVINSAIQ